MSERSDSKRKTLRLFQRVIRQTLTPKERLTVSQCAERYRVLSGSSKVKGKWSNALTPYLCEVMDCLIDPDISRIYFCKSSQIGGTEALLNMLIYIILQDPSPTMIVYPNDDLAKEISNTRVKPALRLIRAIKKIFRETSSKEQELRFSTMTLYLQGSGSPAKLASRPIKYLFFDEVDKLEGASKKEASPFSLALERTKTYRPQEKVYACSTPTLRTNYIWGLHDSAEEVRHYFVPCPHCGSMIEFLWSQVRFDSDDDGKMSPSERAATAVYICQECGCEILDSDKPAMLRDGRWQTVKRRGNGKATSVGFWINSLYSIFLRWSDAVEEFLLANEDAKAGDTDRLQNFVNSWLAEPWEDTRLATDADMVKERQTDVPEYTVPDWAILLTGGVDVQENRLYYVIRAWGEYSTSQLVAHGEALRYSMIEEVMNHEFLTETGDRMRVATCFIDSGYRQDETYDFCVDNADWAFPVKGANHPMRNRTQITKIEKTGSRAYGMQLILVDGGQYKDSIAARMRRENGVGSWMVYDGIDEEYCQQVTAEQKVVEKGAKGAAVSRWVPKRSHADNHYLDCEVYAFAAAEMWGIRTAHLHAEDEGRLIKPDDEMETPEEQWIERNDNWLTQEG